MERKWFLHLLIILLFFPSYIICVNTWDMTKSSTEVSSTKLFISKVTLDTETISTYKQNDKYYIEIGSSSIEITSFTGIDSFVKWDNKYYICTKGVDKPPIMKYDGSSLTNLGLPSGFGDYSKWVPKCYYRPKAQQSKTSNAIIVAFLQTKWFYWYNANLGKWANEINSVEDFIMDVIIEETYHSEENGFYYTYFYYYHQGQYGIIRGKMTINAGSEGTEPKNQQINNIRYLSLTNLGYSKIILNSSSISNFYFYLITYGDSGNTIYKITTTDGNNYSAGTSFSLPLETVFSPNTYTITNFDFINESQYYYYQATSGGVNYWGMGEISTSTIVFNSKDAINSIGEYSTSKRGVLVTTDTKAYFVCPYSLSSLTCDECSSGMLLLNHLEKNVCITSSSNMDNNNGVYSCKAGYIITSSNTCASCSQSGGYTVSPGGACETICDDMIAVKDDTAGAKTCTYCSLLTPSQYLYNGACISEADRPSNTFISDETYKILAKCDDSCTTCETSSTNCLTCSGSYYKSPTDNECLSSCPDYYGIDNSDSTALKCVNCILLPTPKVRYLTGDQTCIERPTNIAIYDVPISATGGVDYGIINTCHSNCESCTEQGTDTDNKCTKCKEGMFLEGSVCVAHCSTTKLYEDTENRKCVNCFSSGYYKYDGYNQTCIQTQPDGTKVTDPAYNIIEDCYLKCSTCSEISTSETDQKCTKCREGFLSEDNNCIDTCEDIYYEDIILKECVNCKTKYTKFKKLGKDNSCIDEPSTPYYDINTEAGVIGMCGTSCLTCNKAPTTGNDNCASCDSGKYLSYLTKNCDTSCTPLYAISDDGVSCVKCSDNSDTTKRFKYEDGTECIARPDQDTQPTYIVSGTTDIIKNCYSTCASCSDGPSADGSTHNCDTCKTGLNRVGSNCVLKCDDPLKGILSGSCVNCKDKGKVKYEDNPNCVDIPSNAYYETESTYGIIKDCHSNCASCSASPNSDGSIQNCDTCSGSLYLKDSNCVSSCEPFAKGSDNKCINCATMVPPQFKNGESCQPSKSGFYVTDEYNNILPCDTSCGECETSATNCISCDNGSFLEYNGHSCIARCDLDKYIGENNECVSCKDKTPPLYKYKGSNSCIERPSDSVKPNYIKDPDLNIIEDCDSSCASCENSATNCVTCPEGYYKHPGSTICKLGCPEKYGIDDTNDSCINCNSQATNKFIKSGTNICIPEPSVPYVIKDPSFGLIELCASNCLTCSGKEETEQNCLTCKSGFYLQPGSSNCESTCPSNYGKYSDNTCVNCKSKGLFKYSNQDTCTTDGTLPEGTYESIPEFGILDSCYSTCKTCSGAGSSSNQLCTSCITGYEDLNSSGNCFPQCVSPNKWYKDSNGSRICLNGSNCPLSHPLLIESTSQCVESCLPSGTCELCSTESLYADNGKCISTCPSGKKKNDSTHVCDTTSILEENGCTTTLIRQSSTASISSSTVTSTFEEQISNFINDNDSKNVRVIQSNEVSYTIFKNDTCGFDISMRYNLTYSNISECIDKLVEAGTVSENEDIIIGELDVTRQTEITNQAGYYLAKSDGTKIDLTPCKDVKVPITYPISEKDIVRFARSGKFMEQGIDLNDPEDDFFNDFCFPYYDDKGKDVLLKDRRKDYFENNTLCENGCNYTTINFKTSRVECSCSLKQSSFDKITENLPFDDFPGSLSSENLFVIRCYNLVFNMNYLKHNAGGWIIVGLFAAQVIAAVNFFIIGLKPLYSYLNQYHRGKQEETSNPPRKKSKKRVVIEEEEESEEEEEEESEEEERSKKRKTSRKTTKKSLLEVNRSDIEHQFESPDLLKATQLTTQAKLPLFDLNKKTGNKIMNNTYISKGEFDAPSPAYSKVKQTSKSNDILDTKVKEGEEEKEFEDDELDDLAYEDALEYDHRNIFKFYCHTLKNNLVFISVFSNISVFEPFCIKLISFLLNLAVYFVLNAALFDDEYISKRYESEESTGFLYVIQNELPKCIYASLASLLVSFLINYLANSRKRFETLMNKEKDMDEKTFLFESKKILKSMRMKLFTFFIVSMVLMAFFWYYVSAFCAVYRKTQLAWIEGTIMTFLFCIVLYSFLYLLVTIARYIGLRCHISCFYTLSGYFI